MVLNYKRIEDRMTELKLSKADVCRKANLSRPTFDGLLNGKDSKISTLVEVAKVLKSPVGYFFDEKEKADINVHDIRDSDIAIGDNISIGDYRQLESKVDYLEKLLAEKERSLRLCEKLLESKN